MTDTRAIVDTATGICVGMLSGAPALLEANTRPGQLLVDTPPPTAHHLWIAGAWVSPPPSAQLGMIAKRKLGELKAARDVAQSSGFTWSGSPFDSDPVSQLRISLAVQQAASDGAAFSVNWTLADDTTRTLSATDVVALASKLSKFLNNQQSTYRTLKAAVKAATTAAQVDAIVWA
jgi:Domain of unknown function (DUF4376)